MEVLARMALAEDLPEQGYRVIEAANAYDALSIVESNAEIDLAITDERMPGPLDGIGLARLIRSRGGPRSDPTFRRSPGSGGN